MTRTQQKMTGRCRKLAEEIRACFKDGVAIDRHTTHYMDTCFPGFLLEDLAGRMGASPDTDIAPLMDLVFFPDEAFQIQLEPLLEKEVFSKEDETRVVGLLGAETIPTTLRDAESRVTVPLQVPEWVLAPFVRRLGIARRIPSRLADTLRDKYPIGMANLLKVMLRNARFPFSQPITGFLDSFFRGMDSSDELFFDCLKLSLTLLGDREQAPSPSLLLHEKREFFSRAKTAAVHFEALLRRSNMETLMHQGVRAPEMGLAEAEEKIALLDLIDRAIS